MQEKSVNIFYVFDTIHYMNTLHVYFIHLLTPSQLQHDIMIFCEAALKRRLPFKALYK